MCKRTVSFLTRFSFSAISVASAMALSITHSPSAVAAPTELSDFPLTSTSSEPIWPNILFILDDSGSMDSDYMPDGISSNTIGFRNFSCNTLAYQPTVSYTIPTMYNAANTLSELNSAVQTTYLSAYNGSVSSAVCGGYYAFHSPACSSSRTSLSGSYYWQLATTGTSGTSLKPDTGICNHPTSSTTTTPATGVCCDTRSDSNYNTACSNPTYPTNSPPTCASGKTLVWTKVPISATTSPSGVDGFQNYANWYTYYRTRLMMMKAAASRAFTSISADYRVGFMTISPGTYGNDSNSTGDATGSSISAAKFLKIDTFSGTHREDWFKKLFSQATSSYTPLRSALSTAGRYFAGRNDLTSKGMIPTQADDPVQYSCQQNFTILTTDGYWNGGSGRLLNGTSQLGNQDGDITELDAYNTINRFAVSPRPIFDGATTQYIWNTATKSYQNTASCTVKQMRTVQTRISTTQLTATQTTTTSATTNIIISSAAKNSTVTAVTINSANRLSSTASAGSSNTASTRRTTLTSALASRLSGGGYKVLASGSCTGANAPVAGCASGTSYVTVAVPAGEGAKTYGVTFSQTGVVLSAINFSGGGVSGPTTTGVTSCNVGTAAVQTSSSLANVVTSACATATTGPTLVATCTNSPASSSNNYTDTSCATTYPTDWTDFPACATAIASALNGYTATECRNFTTGKKIQYRTTANATTYPCPGVNGGYACTSASSATPVVGSWTDLDGTCYGSVPVPAAPPTISVVGSGPPTLPVGCSEWPCETTKTTSGGASNTLADVAQYYYKTDLRNSSLGNCTGGKGTDVCLNDVPALGTGIEDDKANWQHMTTFTMGLGLNGNLAFVPNYKQSGVSPVFEAIRAGTTMWPDPGTGSNSKTIDDLWHAAVNGRGEYFSARDPDTVVSGLNSALSGISARVASAAAAATSNLEPVAGDNFAYIASYVTKEWTGQLQAKEIDLATGQPAPTAVWSAAEKLDLAVGNSCDNRTIKLFRAGASPYNLVDFIWDSAPCNSDGSAGTSVAGNLSATEKAHFQPTGVDTTGATINEILKLIQYSKMSNGSGSPATVNQQSLAAGANLLNFVRGHRGKEGFKSLPLPGTSNDANKLYRERSHVLGDIISAQPVFVKAPQLNYIDDGYATFRSNNTNRTPMVYSAGNDGMLHAFRAGTSILDAQGGTEAWAFIPTMVLPNLYKLASEDYETDHKFFVDGTPTVADVFDPDRLLGSTDPGAGTCADHPENCWRTILVGGLNKGGKGYYALDITDPDVPKALWEFKNSSACMSVNSTTKAAVGNVYTDCEIGYTYTNPTVGKLADGTWVVLLTSGYNNSSGEGFLYILNAVTGRVLYRIGTGSGDASNPSGLNHIAAWVDKPDVNNLLARAYGVDLNGNVWRFDLNDTLGSPGREASLLAQLKDAKGKAQPITTRPMLAAVKGQPWVYVGTGRYLGTDDNTLSDIDKQSIWAIKDQGATVTSPRSSLGERILTNIGEGSSTTRSVTASSCEAGEGWYADFPDKGERANISPKLQLGTLIFPTNVPSGVGCDFGGYGYINYVNYETGCAVTPDPPTPPDPNDPNPPPDPDPNDGDAGKRVPTPCGASQVVGINVVRLPGGKVVVIVTLGCGDTITIDVPFDSPSPSGKRVSWREILQ